MSSAAVSEARIQPPVSSPHSSGASPGDREPAEDERPEPVRVADADHPLLVEDDEAVGAADPRQDLAQRVDGVRRRLVGEERGQQLRVGARGEPAPAALELVEQLAGVDEVAVVADRERPPRAEPQRRLGVLPDRRAGGRVAAVRDRELAPERRDPPLVEHLADHAQVLVDHQVPGVGDPDPRRLLAAVLEREQRGRGDPRRLVAAARQHDADDAAHQRTPSTASAHGASQPSARDSPCSQACRRSATGTSRASAIPPPRSSAAPVAPRPPRQLDDEPRRRRWCRASRPGSPCWRASSSRAGAWRGSASHDEPRRALAEQRDRRRVADGQPEPGAAPAPDRLLRDRDREAATGHVLAALDEAARDRLADERLEPPLAVEVERRRAVLRRRPGEPLVLGAGEARGRPRRPARPRGGPPGTPGPTSVATSSSRPTMPISGVGAIADPGASLYSETLPPVTGRPRARHASPRPRTPSASCQNASGRVGSP